MSGQNAYSVNNLSLLNRKMMNDVRVYEWISCCLFLVPTLSIEECAKSFMAFHNVKEEHMNIEQIRKIYWRINKDLLEEAKTVNQEKFPDRV